MLFLHSGAALHVHMAPLDDLLAREKVILSLLSEPGTHYEENGNNAERFHQRQFRFDRISMSSNESLRIHNQNL